MFWIGTSHGEPYKQGCVSDETQINLFGNNAIIQVSVSLMRDFLPLSVNLAPFEPIQIVKNYFIQKSLKHALISTDGVCLHQQ